MKKIKVLIVEDSAFMRKMIAEFLGEDRRIEVIGTARNGKEAISKIEEQKPDVITLDVEMPVMNGIEALKTIMKQCPTPVIMLSSTTREGTDNTVSAMEIGAFDFIEDVQKVCILININVKLALIASIIGNESNLFLNAAFTWLVSKFSFEKGHTTPLDINRHFKTVRLRTN